MRTTWGGHETDRVFAGYRGCHAIFYFILACFLFVEIVFSESSPIIAPEVVPRGRNIGHDVTTLGRLEQRRRRPRRQDALAGSGMGGGWAQYQPECSLSLFHRAEWPRIFKIGKGHDVTTHRRGRGVGGVADPVSARMRAFFCYSQGGMPANFQNRKVHGVTGDHGSLVTTTKKATT